MKPCLLLLKLFLLIAMSMSNDPLEGIEQFNERLAKIAPNMIYLGNFGYKGWYAFHDKVSQAIARGNCVNFGMKLGVIDSQQELEFIANAATEPVYLTDGLYLCKPSSFRWSTGLRELSPDLNILQLGHSLNLDKTMKRLHTTNSNYPYLCFLSLIRSEYKILPKDEPPVIMERSDFDGPVDQTSVTNQTIAGLTYIGKYGYKSFYYDDTLVHWPTAKENCQKMGMTLARLDSQDELKWIIPLLPNRQTDYVWTDGEIKQGSQYWYWVSNGNNLNTGITIFNHTWGLALVRSQQALRISDKIFAPHTFPYICFVANIV